MNWKKTMFEKLRTKKPKPFLAAYYDQIMQLNETDIIISGWERNLNCESPALSIKLDDASLGISTIDTVRYIRPDVCNHFSDTEQQSWGVLHFIQLTNKIDDIKKLAFILSIPEKQLTVDGVITSEVQPIINTLSLMKGSDYQSAKNYLLTKYADEIIAKTDSTRTPSDQLPGFLKNHIEHSFLIQGFGVYLQGWLIDSDDNLAAMYLKQAGKLSNDILDSYTRFHREDVNQAFSANIDKKYRAGFYGIALSTNFSPSLPVELIKVTKTGVVSTQPIELVTRNEAPVDTIRTLLSQVDVFGSNYQSDLTGFLGNSLNHTWKSNKTKHSDAELKVYGKQCAAPKCSIIVPIYGRYDFVLYQLTQFNKDPEFSNVELIYVLDDPSIETEFNRFCAGISPTFSTPFKTVISSVNLGFAGANNLGVHHATSDVLLLLNSDVMPKEAGWLTQMLKQFTTTDNMGILGARLLFEDETIQHDGLSYHQTADFGDLWLIDHPGKGMPAWMVENKGLHQVPSVTGACMMMSKALYQQVEGLDDSYILGDFEDSDLCLKVRETGLDNYIDSNIELYHLERQSQNLFEGRDWKFKLTIYNGLTHSKRWNDTLHTISSQETI